jgi:hypothetical protein
MATFCLPVIDSTPKINECGECRECCITFPLLPNKDFWPEGKVAYKPCRFLCESGCSIHDKPRPKVCTDFRCMYGDRILGNDPSIWRPDKCGVMFYEASLLALLRGLLDVGRLPWHWQNDDSGIGIVETRPEALVRLDPSKIRYHLQKIDWRLAVVFPYGFDVLAAEDKPIRIYDDLRIAVWWKADPDYADRVCEWWTQDRLVPASLLGEQGAKAQS